MRVSVPPGTRGTRASSRLRSALGETGGVRSRAAQSRLLAWWLPELPVCCAPETALKRTGSIIEPGSERKRDGEGATELPKSSRV